MKLGNKWSGSIPHVSNWFLSRGQTAGSFSSHPPPPPPAASGCPHPLEAGLGHQTPQHHYHEQHPPKIYWALLNARNNCMPLVTGLYFLKLFIKQEDKASYLRLRVQA